MFVTPLAYLPVILQLRPAVAHYAATVSWEAYANGDHQLTTISKKIMMQVQPHAAGWAVTLTTSPPTFTEPPDPEPLAEIALRLAALYARLVVQATPAGEIVSLLNHYEIQYAGNQLLHQLRAAAPADEPVTAALLSFVDRQLQSPASVLNSLAQDYLYQTLLATFYNQPLGEATKRTRSRQFVNFFDKTALWFSERLAVEPAPESEQVCVRLHGTLDTHKTDLPAVRHLIDQALRLSLPPGAAPLPAEVPVPHFRYEAAYILEAATGLPLRVTLNVYARAGLLFNKEYTLTLIRQ